MLRTLTLITSCALIASHAYAAPPGKGKDRPVAVITSEAAMQTMTNRIEALGTTKANESLEIRPKVSGIVAEVKFEDGQQVDADAELVVIDNEIESAELKEAEVNRAEALREYKRIQKLVKQGAAATTRLDEQHSRLKAADAVLDAERAKLKERTVKAPFAGVLGLRQVSPGSLVTPQTVITTLDDVGQLKLDFTIPEVHLASVAKDMRVEASSSAYAAQVFSGTVSAINSRIDPITRAATVRAIIPNDGGLLKPGMLMSVKLITSEKPRLVISERAIVSEKRQNFLYVLSGEDSVEKREVKTGYRYPGLVEVVEGLEVGETVVTEGIQKLDRPGVKVKPMNANKEQN